VKAIFDARPKEVFTRDCNCERVWEKKQKMGGFDQGESKKKGQGKLPPLKGSWENDTPLLMGGHPWCRGGGGLEHGHRPFSGVFPLSVSKNGFSPLIGQRGTRGRSGEKKKLRRRWRSRPPPKNGGLKPSGGRKAGFGSKGEVGGVGSGESVKGFWGKMVSKQKGGLKEHGDFWNMGWRENGVVKSD